jgi:hypothetical protein
MWWGFHGELIDEFMGVAGVRVRFGFCLFAIRGFGVVGVGFGSEGLYLSPDDTFVSGQILVSS